MIYETHEGRKTARFGKHVTEFGATTTSNILDSIYKGYTRCLHGHMGSSGHI